MADNVLFLAANRTFSKRDDIPCYNTNINKHKIMKTIACIASEHPGLKLEINAKRNHRSFRNNF